MVENNPAPGIEDSLITSQLASLKEQNEKLKTTIADVFDALNEVKETSDRDLMFDAIDDACEYIISDWPDFYSYADEDESSETVGEQDTTIDENPELERTLLTKLRSRMAAELNVAADELEQIKDPNLGVPAVRRSIIKEIYGENALDAVMSPEEYQSAITTHFLWLVIFSATPPISFKKEAQRYSETFGRLKSKIPKNPRPVGPDVQTALDMLEQGKDWSDIADAIFGPLVQGRERRNALNNLKAKWRSLRSIRERRARNREKGNITLK